MVRCFFLEGDISCAMVYRRVNNPGEKSFYRNLVTRFGGIQETLMQGVFHQFRTAMEA